MRTIENPPNIWQLKGLSIPSVGEAVVQTEISHVAGGYVNWYNICGNSLA